MDRDEKISYLLTGIGVLWREGLAGRWDGLRWRWG
jgi:hypothetical protein